MSDKSTSTDKEIEILHMVKKVLTDVAKETFTRPGYSHPLSDNTILGIRDCLGLISARETELKGGSELRPHFKDEPRKTEVVVSLDSLRNPKNPNKDK